MMTNQHAVKDEQPERAHKEPEPKGNYELRVIDGAGGMLELVEVQPRKHQWFHDWVRAMQFVTWIH